MIIQPTGWTDADPNRLRRRSGRSQGRNRGPALGCVGNDRLADGALQLAEHLLVVSRRLLLLYWPLSAPERAGPSGEIMRHGGGLEHVAPMLDAVVALPDRGAKLAHDHDRLAFVDRRGHVAGQIAPRLDRQPHRVGVSPLPSRPVEPSRCRSDPEHGPLRLAVATSKLHLGADIAEHRHADLTHRTSSQDAGRGGSLVRHHSVSHERAIGVREPYLWTTPPSGTAVDRLPTEPRRPAMEIALLWKVRRPPGRQVVRLPGRDRIPGHLLQMRTYGVEPMVLGHPPIRRQPLKQG